MQHIVVKHGIHILNGITIHLSKAPELHGQGSPSHPGVNCIVIVTSSLHSKALRKLLALNK